MKLTKKTMAMFLATALLAGMLFAVPAFANGTGNLALNPGFESTETRTLSGDETYLWPSLGTDEKEVWDVKGQGLYTYTDKGVDAYLVNSTDEPANVHSGDYAMKMISEAASKRRLWQKLTNLTPGSWYEASVWVKAVPPTETTNYGGYNVQGAEVRIGRSENGGYNPDFVNNGWIASSTDQHAQFNLGLGGDGNGPLIDTYGKWSQIMVRWQQPAAWDEDGLYDPTTAYLVFETGYLNSCLVTYYYDDVLVRQINSFNGDFSDTFNGGFESVSTQKIDETSSVAWPTGLGLGVFYTQSGLADDMNASTAEARTGSYSLQMKSASTKGYYKACRSAHLFVPGLEGGKTYKLTAYAKIDGSTDGTCRIAIGPSYIGSMNQNWYYGTVVPSTETWKEISIVFTVPDAKFTYGYVQLFSGALSEGGSLYWDDISVTETNVSLSKGENAVTASVEYINGKASAQKATLVLATYKVTGDIKRITGLTILESDSVSTKNFTSFTESVPFTSEDTEVKAFLYESPMVGFTSLVDPVTLSLGE